ncbi:hypothetical protein MKY22_07080 [Exiguobacterium sp. FSL W8-0210]|uniref:hypothetical protein n=1 Tax=Exiguobacterium sp. FSL W8-0210 TaxID=2921598 RepID=UPI0030F5B88F
MTAVWLIYRDGRKLYTYHGVMNEIHQDDMKQAMEDRYLFRYQAKRRMNTWISEKQAEGYIFEDVFGLTPNRKKRQTFKRRMIGLASLQLSSQCLRYFKWEWSFSVKTIYRAGYARFVSSVAVS